MIDRKPSFHRAFTLIELLTVVSVIAILAAIAVPNFLEAQVRSKVSRARSDMAMISAALESYRLDHGFYPRQSTPIHPAEIRHLMKRLNDLSSKNLPSLMDEIKAQPTPVPITPTPTPTKTPAPVAPENQNPWGQPAVGFGYGWPLYPAQPTTSDNEAATSAALARHGLIHSPFGGNGLYALTTPVCYISAELMRDPFSGRGLGWASQGSNFGFELFIDPVFCYVNVQQIDLRGWTIEGLGANLPYLLFSASPSTSMPMFPFPPLEPAVLYDPTNGTVSDGIVFNWRE